MSTSLHLGDGMDVPVDEILGRCIAVLGIRGSGKTNTSAVLAEEFLSKNIPLCIVDIDGEYWGLKERFEILVAGRSAKSDIKVEPQHGAALARESIRNGVPIILDMSDYTMDDVSMFLYEYLVTLWRESETVRQPYQVILEEAHEFVPQGIRTDLKDVLTRIALRGRKRGLGVTLLSQRSAKVEKDILTQAEILFLHRVVHPADMRVYRDLIPWPSDKVERVVQSLEPGQAMVCLSGSWNSQNIRPRVTYHAGYTPTLSSGVPRPKLRNVRKELLARIETATLRVVEHEDALTAAQKKAESLRQQIAERDKVIEQLESQISILSRLEVRLDPSTIPTFSPIMSTEQSPLLPPKQGYVIPKETSVHLERIARRLRALNAVRRAMLKFLVSRYPTPYTYAQLEGWTGYAISTLHKNNLSPLLSLGIVAKERKGDGYHFRASIPDFIAREFSLDPRRDPNLISRLTDRLQSVITGL